MKKLILILGLTLSTVSFAQSTEQDDVDIVQAVYGKEKTEIVSKYMALTGAQADAFAKVYNEYEVERKQLGQKKFQIIKEYAANYGNFTDQTADQIGKKALDNITAYDKLHTKYYEKVKKAIGAVNAVKFMQLEVYLQTIVSLELQTKVPFIGELDATISK